jgi:signal peptidase I
MSITNCRNTSIAHKKMCSNFWALGAIVFMLISLASCNQRFVVTSTSMMPTLKPKDVVEVEKYLAHENPAVGDLVAFTPPSCPGCTWIMRLAGGPGQRIDFTDDDCLVVNGAKMSTFGPVARFPRPERPFGLPHPIDLRQDEYYVLGDNPMNSYDSRFWGALKRSMILGRVRRVDP